MSADRVVTVERVFMSRMRIAAVGVALAVLLGPVFLDMARTWWSSPYGGHGLYVPLFAALMARQRLRGFERSTDPRGALLALPALALLAAGYAHHSLALRHAALILLLVALAWWVLGPNGLRRVAIPLAFLVLMAPVPSALVHFASLTLRRVAAEVAAEALALFGIPVFRTDVMLHLPSGDVEVAAACDGLRFLAALLTLGIAASDILVSSPGRRAALIALTALAALVANAVRVTAIVAAAGLFGLQAATGLPHHVIGKTTWLAAAAVVLGTTWLMRARPPSFETHAKGE